MIVGIDQSKRSTAAVTLYNNGDLAEFVLVTPPKEIDQQWLIDYQWTRLNRLFQSVMESGDIIDGFALEGAAFAAKGASNDLLWGLQWYIRTRLLVEYPDSLVGIITAATWRSTILPIEVQREYKARYGGKIGLKHAMLDALPSNVRFLFEEYVERMKDQILVSKGLKPGSKSNAYKDNIFDLADAWGIATHRVKLLNGTAKKAKVVKEKPKLSVLKRRFPNAV